jgi:hypothetical protein
MPYQALANSVLVLYFAVVLFFVLGLPPNTTFEAPARKAAQAPQLNVRQHQIDLG